MRVWWGTLKATTCNNSKFQFHVQCTQTTWYPQDRTHLSFRQLIGPVIDAQVTTMLKLWCRLQYAYMCIYILVVVMALIPHSVTGLHPIVGVYIAISVFNEARRWHLLIQLRQTSDLGFFWRCRVWETTAHKPIADGSKCSTDSAGHQQTPAGDQSPRLRRCWTKRTDESLRGNVCSVWHPLCTGQFTYLICLFEVWGRSLSAKFKNLLIYLRYYVIYETTRICTGFRRWFTSLPSLLCNLWDYPYLPWFQVLITKPDFTQPGSRKMLQSTLNDLLSMNIVPILNENDVVGNDSDSK